MNRMIRKIGGWKPWGTAGVVTCLMLFSLISGCMEENQDDDGDDFTFKDLDGTMKHLSDYRGKVVILDMWATWCTPCVFQIGELKKAYENYSRDDLEILSIDVDTGENTTVIQSYLQNFSLLSQYELEWVFGLDTGNSIWLHYHLEGEGIPTLYIFDRAGTPQFSHEGITWFSEIPQGYSLDTPLLKPLLDDLVD